MPVPHSTRAGRLVCLCLLWLLFPLCQAQSLTARVSYTLTFPELLQQNIRIETRLPVTAGETPIFLPTWTPGSYLIRNNDAYIEILSVRDSAGSDLPLHKVSGDRWLVQSEKDQTITVRYRAHAANLDVGASWASPEYILINGATLFLYTRDSRDLPQDIFIRETGDLGSIYTALSESADGAGWSARNFDELLDCPVLIGHAADDSFSASDVDYHLVTIGGYSLWDNVVAARDVKSIVETGNRFWGVVPFGRDYWIFNLLDQHGGGLEHNQGAVIMGSRWAMRERQDYVRWLGLVSHEYFHAWNVRRMRPEELGRYDYQMPQYTGSLWVAEGLTSYYDDLLLSRAQLITPTEYFAGLAQKIHNLELTPGRQHISLDQASRDSWTRHYQPNANSINADVSYYLKGAVLGFVLDARIRKASKGKSSLDDVMRGMYQKWQSRPYPEQAFEDAVESVAGREIRQWLQPLIYTTAELDVDEALAWFGLRLDRNPGKTAAVQAGQSSPPGLGINWSADTSSLVVDAVVDGYAAAQAGVLPGDELLAMDDERVTRNNFEDRKAGLEPGETVTLLLVRQGHLIKLPVTVGDARPLLYEMLISKTFGNRHLHRLEDWLGQALKLAKNPP